MIGILALTAAFRFRSGLGSDWLVAVTGVLSVLFGIAVLVSPAAGVVVLATLVGIYALLFGISLIVHAFRLRKAQ